MMFNVHWPRSQRYRSLAWQVEAVGEAAADRGAGDVAGAHVPPHLPPLTALNIQTHIGCTCVASVLTGI